MAQWELFNCSELAHVRVHTQSFPLSLYLISPQLIEWHMDRGYWKQRLPLAVWWSPVIVWPRFRFPSTGAQGCGGGDLANSTRKIFLGRGFKSPHLTYVVNSKVLTNQML